MEPERLGNDLLDVERTDRALHRQEIVVSVGGGAPLPLHLPAAHRHRQHRQERIARRQPVVGIRRRQAPPDLVARVGTDRLLWGSDAPFVGYEKRVTYDRVLASWYRWLPDPRLRAEIDRTALDLYFSS